jgi:hypothetical protein
MSLPRTFSTLALVVLLAPPVLAQTQDFHHLVRAAARMLGDICSPTLVGSSTLSWTSKQPLSP